MKYKNIYDHSLFTDGKAVYRKASNAFAVNVSSGVEICPELDEEFHPIHKTSASKMTGIDEKYL